MSFGVNLNTLPGSSAMNDVEQMQKIRVAMTYGHNFIKIIHRQGGSTPERIYPADGVKIFEEFDVKSNMNIKKARIVEGSEGIYFIPDEMTGLREAFVLDTAFNREILASSILEDRWVIEDPQTAKEIKALADKRPGITFDTSKMSQDAGQQFVIREEDMVANLTLKQKKEMIEKRKEEIRLLEAGVADDPDSKMLKPGSSAPQVPTAAPGSKESEDQIMDSIPQAIRAECIKAVHSMNGTQVGMIKQKHGADYKNSQEYRDTILPKIKALIASKMEEIQA